MGFRAMARLIDLEYHHDSRGTLVVAESQIPFTPRRIFWIAGADGQLRGGHRHKCTETLLVAVHGEVSIEIQSPTDSESVILNSPRVALYLAPQDWHAMRFGASSVLLAITSTRYDADDYVTTPYRRLAWV